MIASRRRDHKGAAKSGVSLGLILLFTTLLGACSWVSDREGEASAGAEAAVAVEETVAAVVAVDPSAAVVRLRNPHKWDLFYTDAQEVEVHVVFPAVFEAASPRVDYIFFRGGEDGSLTPLARESASSFEREGDSLVCKLNFGRRQHGVYAIEARVPMAGGRVIGKALFEPIVVVRKMELQQVAGTHYTEGLDLELEDEIDFTDPNDPHPWIEGRVLKVVEGVETPQIVEKDGLRYREVSDGKRSSYFSYRIDFEHPGDFYLMEVEYPDNAERLFNVSVSRNERRRWNNSQTGVGVETGGKFHTTETMQTLRWIHVADPGRHSVDIINSVNGWPGAAKSLKIYHVKGDLPAIKTGDGRRYGIYTERCYTTSGFARAFGVEAIPGTEKELPEREQLIKDLAWKEATCDRFVQYLKFTGQNLNHMGCIQYTERNTPYVPREEGSSSVLNCMRTMLANVLDANDIAFLTGIQLCNPRNLETDVTDAEVAGGATTKWMVNAAGEQRSGLFTMVPNWQHPGYVSGYHRILNSLLYTFGDFEHYRGVTNLMGPLAHPRNYYPPGYGMSFDRPLEYSYDDITFEHFERDTGMDLGIDPNAPDRFAQRAARVAEAPLRQRFLDWRCRRYADFCDGIARIIEEKRSDLDFVNFAIDDMERELAQYLLQTDKNFKAWLEEFAMDFELLTRRPNQMICRTTVSWRAVKNPLDELASQDPYRWILRERELGLAPFEGLPRQAVLCRSSWDENSVTAPGHEFSDARIRNVHDTPRPGMKYNEWFLNSKRTRSHPQPGGYHAREALIQAIITGDPELLLGGFCDLSLNLGHEQVIREMISVYTHLPEERFDTVLDTRLDTNFAIRKLNGEAVSYLYVANPGYWPISGTLAIQAGAPVREIVSGREVAQAGAGDLRVSLAPYGLAAYRIASSDFDVRSYDTEPTDRADLARTYEILDRVDELLEDPSIRDLVPESDADYMEETLLKARAEMAAGEYARAWHRVKAVRFWTFWKQFLEPAAKGARVPGFVRLAARSQDDAGRPVATVRRTDQPISLDGRLDEPVWQDESGFQNYFVTPKERFPAFNQTAFKAAWDDEALYLAFVCADPDTSRIKTEAVDEDTVFISRDDVLDIFLQPDEETALYYQMAFNFKGVQFDQRVESGERDYEYHPDWRIATSAGAGHWIAEVRLPFAGFGLDGPGDTAWRMNLFRIMRDDEMETSSWSHTGKNWHAPDRFGRLRFED